MQESLGTHTNPHLRQIRGTIVIEMLEEEADRRKETIIEIEM